MEPICEVVIPWSLLVNCALIVVGAMYLVAFLVQEGTERAQAFQRLMGLTVGFVALQMLVFR